MVNINGINVPTYQAFKYLLEKVENLEKMQVDLDAISEIVRNAKLNSDIKTFHFDATEKLCTWVWCDHIKSVERGKSSSVQGFYWGYYKSPSAYPQNICDEWKQCPICGVEKP